MQTTHTLTLNRHHDLIAIPSLLLGFHPECSCVALGVRDATVLFCARLELGWHEHYFDQAAEQLHNAVLQAGECDWIVVGYGPDEEAVAPSLEELVGVLGEHRVQDCLVADGESFWPYGYPEEAQPYSFESSGLAAQAVFRGINVVPSRQACVAEVEESSVDAARWREARRSVAALGPGERLELLQKLLTGPRPGEAAAARLAVLLQDEECFAATLTELSTGNAELRFEPLARARRQCPDEAAPNLLALLGLCCWLAGRSAQHTSCLEQLARSDPGHPVLGLLLRVHRLAIPPRRWDEE